MTKGLVIFWVDGGANSEELAHAADLRADGYAVNFHNARKFSSVDPCSKVYITSGFDQVLGAYVGAGIEVIGFEMPVDKPVRKRRARKPAVKAVT